MASSIEQELASRNPTGHPRKPQMSQRQNITPPSMVLNRRNQSTAPNLPSTSSDRRNPTRRGLSPSACRVRRLGHNRGTAHHESGSTIFSCGGQPSSAPCRWEAGGALDGVCGRARTVRWGVVRVVWGQLFPPPALVGGRVGAVTFCGGAGRGGVRRRRGWRRCGRARERHRR